MVKSKLPRKDCRVLLWETAACMDDAAQLLRSALRGIAASDASISACIIKAARCRCALNEFLQRAFLTPIDREDVYLLGQDAANAVQAVCCTAAFARPTRETAGLLSAAADCACAVPALYALLRDKAAPAAIHAACEALRKSVWNNTMLYLRLKRQVSGTAVPDSLLNLFEACVKAADRMEYVLIKND